MWQLFSETLLPSLAGPRLFFGWQDGNGRLFSACWWDFHMKAGGWGLDESHSVLPIILRIGVLFWFLQMRKQTQREKEQTSSFSNKNPSPGWIDSSASPILPPGQKDRRGTNTSFYNFRFWVIGRTFSSSSWQTSVAYIPYSFHYLFFLTFPLVWMLKVQEFIWGCRELCCLN